MSNKQNQANQVHGFGQPVREGRRVSGEAAEAMNSRKSTVVAAVAFATALGPKFYEVDPYTPQPQIAANLGIQTMNLMEQQRAPQPAAQPDPVAELYAQRPDYTQSAERLGVPIMNSVIDSGAGYDVAALQGDQHAEFV